MAVTRIIGPSLGILSQNDRWKNLEFSLIMLVSSCFRKETNPEVMIAFFNFLFSAFRKNYEAGNYAACQDLLGTLRSQTDKVEALKMELHSQLAAFSHSISDALRTSSGGSEIALEFVRSCGQEGAGFLLNLLADEEDLHTRARLIGYVERLDRSYLIPQLEEKASDSRWYVVRNVVTIVGKLKLRDANRLLEKALMNPDPRIAREVLKSLFRTITAADAGLVIQLLQNPDKTIRLQAIHLANSLNLDSSIPILLKYASTGTLADTDLRAASFQALLKLNAVDAIPMAVHVLERKPTGKAEIPERNAAVKLLGELNREQFRAFLQKISSSDPYPETRAVASSYLQ